MSGADQPAHLDLVGLLRGELSNAQVLDAEDHLRGCADCRDDLLVTVTGHALLTRTSGALDDVDLPAAPPLEPWVPRRRPRLRLAAAAAAVLVAGVGLGAVGASLLTEADEPGSESPVTPAVTAVLEPVEGAGAGQVEMSAGDAGAVMTVRTTGLPEAPTGGFYYVWLLDPETNKMLPLGVVAPGGTATFRIDEALLAAYSAVDVSLEADDGDPGHSVTSVLRGTYDA